MKSEKKKKFAFREGTRAGGNPQAIGEELEGIRRKDGSLTSEGVVAAAKKSSSPLHEWFVWDDGEAAHKFRLVQARTLIRVIVVMQDDKTEPVSQYVHVRQDGPSGRYEPMDVVVQDMSAYQAALQELQTKMSGAARAVQELRKAAGESEHKSKLAIINIVAKSLEAAIEAIKKLAG